jgi:type II secretion system (T2SS) protein E
MPTLSSTLVRRGAASMRAVEDAIARQVLHGGDLPTNLLELGAVSEATLTAILAESAGLDPAPTGRLEAPSPAVLRLIPVDLALRHSIFPIAQPGRVLIVATAEPLSTAVQDDLGFALDLEIATRIAPLVRVRQALAEHYGVALDRRFERLVARLEGMRDPSPSAMPPPEEEGYRMRPPRTISVPAPSFGTGVSSPPSPLDPRDVPSPPASLRAPRGRLEEVPAMKTPFRSALAAPPVPVFADEGGGGLALDELTPYAPPLEEPSAPRTRVKTAPMPSVVPADPQAPAPAPPPAAEPVMHSTPEGTHALAGWVRHEMKNERASALLDKTRTELRPALRSSRRKGPFTAKMAEDELEAATTTDAVLDVVFAFSAQFFEYSALFVIQGDLAEGRDASGPGASRERVTAIGVPLDLPSSLERLRRHRAPMVGPLEIEGLDADLIRDLGREGARPGRSVALLPLLIRTRAVAILFGDDGEADVTLSGLGDVISFSALAARALERILVRKKLGARAPEMPLRPPTAPPPAPKPHTRPSAGAVARVRALVETPAAPPVAPAPLAEAIAPIEDAFAPIGDVFAPSDDAVAPSDDVVAPARNAVAAPEEAVAAPEEAVAPADEAVAAPDEAVAPADEAVAPADEAVAPANAAAPIEDAPEESLDLSRSREAASNFYSYAAEAVPFPEIHEPEPVTEVAPLALDASEYTFDQSRSAPAAAAIESFADTDSLDFGPEESVRPTLLGLAPDSTDDAVSSQLPPLHRPTVRRLRAARPGDDAPPEPRGRRGTAPVFEGRAAAPPPPTPLEPLPRTPPPNATAWTSFPSHSPTAPPALQRRSPISDQPPIPREEAADSTPGAAFLDALEPSPGGPLPSIIVDVGAEYSSLLQRVIDGGPGSHEAFDDLVRHGEQVLQALMTRFPGPLRVDRHRARDQLPAASQCGPILEILVAIRRPSLPFISVRASAVDPEVRFWATHVLGELRYPEAATVLVPRLFDDDAGVRRIARRSATALVAAGAPGEPILLGLDNITRNADHPSPHRILAIETMGEIRSGAMVPALIAVLEGRADDVADAARRALLLITRQDHARDARRWHEWWARNSTRHRIEWLMDALMNEQPSLRRAAGDELKLITKEYFGYYDDLPKKERERAQSLYRTWWEREGKQRFA